MQDVEMGSLPTIRAAVNANAKGVDYYRPCLRNYVKAGK